ncbi:MAG TPA: hemerythrin domain-containing protein [Terriglobia bacterium]|nr:hemerythrin domain-containing protein [Terriglobia bacterium]
MKCTELVMRDHAVLRRGLTILDGMIKKLEAGDRIEIADVNAVLRFFKTFGDDYHQTVEEKSLFPVLVRATRQDSPIHQMVQEHGEERALVSWMMDAMASRRVVDFAHSARRLNVILRRHLDMEDSILSQLAGQLLTPEADETIAEQFAKNHQDPDLLVNFARLERKYLPKPDTVVREARPEFARSQAAASPR